MRNFRSLLGTLKIRLGSRGPDCQVCVRILLHGMRQKFQFLRMKFLVWNYDNSLRERVLFVGISSGKSRSCSWRSAGDGGRRRLRDSRRPTPATSLCGWGRCAEAWVLRWWWLCLCYTLVPFHTLLEGRLKHCISFFNAGVPPWRQSNAWQTAQSTIHWICRIIQTIKKTQGRLDNSSCIGRLVNVRPS